MFREEKSVWRACEEREESEREGERKREERDKLREGDVQREENVFIKKLELRVTIIKTCPSILDKGNRNKKWNVKHFFKTVQLSELEFVTGRAVVVRRRRE